MIYKLCNSSRLKCGSMEYYDKTYDRVSTKNEKPLKRINRIFHKVTTTDDPMIRQVCGRILDLVLNFVSMLLHHFAQNSLR